MKTQARMNGRLKFLVAFLLIFVSLSATFQAKVNAGDFDPGEIEQGDEPNLPDLSHQLLGLHAAESHGNSPNQVAWIAQGAYDEDHQPIPTFGWHGWDPDTGEYWWSPLGDGPALERANMLFLEAVELYEIDIESGWKKFGQSLHLLQDLSTPAHAHADSHACLAGIGDCDSYETWLGVEDLANTLVWLNANPPSPVWDRGFFSIPAWEVLTADLQEQLESANLVYGGYPSGRDLWEQGPANIDPVLFQLMYLMAESADNYNSGGISEYPGEFYNGDLSDSAYLESMRDALLPLAIEYSTMWIDYFEYRVGIQDNAIFLPFLQK